MEWLFYVVAGLVAVGITASAVFALRWSIKRGQLRDFDRGAESIFDDKEPIGQTTDHFPGRRRAKP